MIKTEKHYTYEELLDKIQQMAKSFDDFSIFRIAGTSHDGRDIPMLRVGLGMDVIVCTAGLSGKEKANPMNLLSLAEEYCSAYREHRKLNGLDVYWLLNRCSICFLPLLNPDGYEIVRAGFETVKNPLLRRLCRMARIPADCWEYNARGVDLNMNFPCRSYIQKQLRAYPASEAETQALIHILDEYDSVGYIDFYSYTRTASGGNTINFYTETIGRPAFSLRLTDRIAPLKILSASMGK